MADRYGTARTGGLTLAMRAGQRRCTYGYGYVYSGGSVVRPMLDCDSNDGELGDDGDLEALLGTSDPGVRDEVQELIPRHVEPWRWGRSLGSPSVMPPPARVAASTRASHRPRARDTIA